MAYASKMIFIGNHQHRITGQTDDRYFQNIESFAKETLPMYNFVEQFVPAGGVLLDVGANIGLTSLAMSDESPASNIFAFEPSPTNARFS